VHISTIRGPKTAPRSLGYLRENSARIKTTCQKASALGMSYFHRFSGDRYREMRDASSNKRMRPPGIARDPTQITDLRKDKDDLAAPSPLPVKGLK
jgi:hypothetical protein